MALLRSPTQQPSYSTTATSDAALEAMRRNGTPTQMANAPAPTAAPATGVGAAIGSYVNPAANMLTRLGQTGAAGAVTNLGNSATRLVNNAQPNTTPAPSGPAPGSGRLTPASNDAAPEAGGAPGETPPRTDLVTATSVDMGPSVELYNKMLAENEAAWGKQQESLHNIYSANNRRNASNAALAGMSVGGGGYLAGQRQAAMSSANAFNNAWLANNQQRQGIFGQYAGALGNAAGQNASLGQQAAIFNAGREGDIQDRTANAEATKLGNDTINSLGNISGGLKSAGIDVAGQKGATWKVASDLETAVRNAPAGSPEQAAAFQKYQAYADKVAKATQDFKSMGQNLPPDFYTSMKVLPGQATLDLYLKYLEKQGFFNV